MNEQEQIRIITDFLFHHTHNGGFQECLDKAELLFLKLNPKWT